jgi:predicted MFS family arabinose efflux permease
MLVAITVFPASLIAGLLYKNVSPSWAFYYGAIMAAAAFVMLATEPMVWRSRPS